MEVAMTGKWIMVLAAASAMAVGGCDRQQPVVDASTGAPRMVEPVTELVGQGRPPIPDFPVPVGFALNESLSRNFAAAGLRSVEHVYDGKADKFAVKRFYQQQMPVSRWVLQNDLVAEGTITMEFEKEGHGERCTVVITTREWWHLFHPTRIAARLYTSGRAEGSK
jgi:hypothetical protein